MISGRVSRLRIRDMLKLRCLGVRTSTIIVALRRQYRMAPIHESRLPVLASLLQSAPWPVSLLETCRECLVQQREFLLPSDSSSDLIDSKYLTWSSMRHPSQRRRFGLGSLSE